MKPHIITLAFITSLTAFAPLRAEPAAPPVATEMKELDRWVGTWKVVSFVSKQAEWCPKETSTSGAVAVTKPILGGHCIEDRTTHSPDGVEHLGIWNWSPEDKAFHYHYFDTAGSRHLFTFRWDAASQSFACTAPMPNGVTWKGTTRFPDANTKEWHSVATDASGKVYLDIKSKEVRVEK